MADKYMEIVRFYLYFLDQASEQLRNFIHFASEEKIVKVLGPCTSIFEMNDAVSDIDI